MKKYVLWVIVVLLSSISGLLAQNIWDNSACLYQSNSTEVILRDEISTGTIIFSTLNRHLFLNTFDDNGNPTIEEPLDLGIGNNQSLKFMVTKSDNDNFLIYWKDGDYINLKKVTADGDDLWETPFSISIVDYTENTLIESKMIEHGDFIYLVANYWLDNFENIIIQYKIDVSNNNPQFLGQTDIFEGSQICALNGIANSEGISLIWKNLAEGKVQIYKDGVVNELLVANLTHNWSQRFPETGKIIELDEHRTIYALFNGDYLEFSDFSSGLFIYNDLDSSITNVPLENALLDIQEISETEFMAITMSADNIIFNKFDQLGNIISTNELEHSFDVIFVEGDYVFDEIQSINSRVADNEYKIALATLSFSQFMGTGTNLVVFSIDLNTEVCSELEINISYTQQTYSTSFAILKESNVSVLNCLSGQAYKVYKQIYSPYQEDVQATVNPYEIAKTNYYNISVMETFAWQGNNQVLMGSYMPYLEINIGEDAVIGDLGFISPMPRYSKLHQLSDDSYLFHYVSQGTNDYAQEYYKIKIYNEDGTTEEQYLPSSYENSTFSSLSDVNDGNGWFVYKYDDYHFHRIDNNIFQTDYSQPIPNLQLLAIKNNYLLLNIDNQFRLTKIDDNGDIADGWDISGASFTTDFDSTLRKAMLYSYQDKVIFSYQTDGFYKVYLIDPQNITETVVHSQASWELPAYDTKDRTNEFIVDNNFYYIQKYNNSLTMYCYDLENDFAEVWQREIAIDVRDNFAIKELDNRFVIAYSKGNEGSERVYLKTIDFYGNEDQYTDGYVVPLNLENQYLPKISVVDANTIYVTRIESNSVDTPGVYCDLVDLTYFVDNSSEDVPPVSFTATNYPNPFNPETTISYNLPQAGDVILKIFNLKGQLVKTLVDEVQYAGNQKVLWKGNNNQNKQVSSGIYLYRIESMDSVLSGKMILMK